MAQCEALRERQQSLLLNPTVGPQHKGGSLRCEDWHTYYNTVVLKSLKRSDGNLTDAITTTRQLVQGCSYCLKAVEMWGRNVDATMSLFGSRFPFSSFFKTYAGAEGL